MAADPISVFRQAIWLGGLLLLSACASTLQSAQKPGAAFIGPRLEGDRFVSFDGARLGLTRWDAQGGAPWAIVVALHGMNDYANAFHLLAPYLAGQGVTTLAFDQRGFGRSPNRGLWAPDALTIEDLRTLTALARRECKRCVVAVAGESMGGSLTLEAFASDRPPDADRVVLLAPGVWGFRTQPLVNRVALWLAYRLTPSKVYTPPRFVTDHISPTDNREELMAMGRDPLMIWGARSDTLYALVRTMQRGSDATASLHAPSLYLYGAHDQIVPKSAARVAVRRLPAGVRTAYYPEGWHLLTRDHAGPQVWADILAFLRDPAAPLPSGAAPIPTKLGETQPRQNPASASAGSPHPPHV